MHPPFEGIRRREGLVRGPGGGAGAVREKGRVADASPRGIHDSRGFAVRRPAILPGSVRARGLSPGDWFARLALALALDGSEWRQNGLALSQTGWVTIYYYGSNSVLK